MSTRNMSICVWCRNRIVDVCLRDCQPEGRYRYLEPDALEPWEAAPELPAFRALVDLPAMERLAVIYLSLVYERCIRDRSV